MHSLHALCASLRRGGGRPHLGCHGAGRGLPHHFRLESTLGIVRHLYGLRQVHPRLSDRGAGREGKVGDRNGKAPAIPALSDADEGETLVSKVRVATLWLDGCSGCHMSFLDQDERLLELAEKVEL